LWDESNAVIGGACALENANHPELIEGRRRRAATMKRYRSHHTQKPSRTYAAQRDDWETLDDSWAATALPLAYDNPTKTICTPRLPGFKRSLYSQPEHLDRLGAGEVEAIVDDESWNAPDTNLHRFIVLILDLQIKLTRFETRLQVRPVEANF